MKLCHIEVRNCMHSARKTEYFSSDSINNLFLFLNGSQIRSYMV